jgi:hypothetical protein
MSGALGQPASLRDSCEGNAVTLAIACEDGTARWLADGCRGRLVGDGPGALWWRMLELRAAQELRATCA